MILFLSDFSSTNADGFFQRVLSIDNSFRNEKRIYIKIELSNKFKKLNFQKINSKCEFLNLNIWQPTHNAKLITLLLEADFVYVHSIYNAMHILPFYKIKKIITDMHGLVPEEILLQTQNQIFADEMNQIENIVIRNSYYIINVSNAMELYFKKKYPKVSIKSLVIPYIHPFHYSKQKKINEKKFDKNINHPRKYNFVYAGGTQQWQNTDLLLEAIKKANSKHIFIILTQDLKNFLKKARRFKVAHLISIQSVPKKEIANIYRNADFGFILRDDIPINRVACPGKLSEYLLYRVIPIVLNPDIGDFNKMKYKYITLADFINGKLPTDYEIVMMKDHNEKIVKKLTSIFKTNIGKLIKIKNNLDQNRYSTNELNIYLNSKIENEHEKNNLLMPILQIKNFGIIAKLVKLKNSIFS